MWFLIYIYACQYNLTPIRFIIGPFLGFKYINFIQRVLVETAITYLQLMHVSCR